jgi:hypothetical protein
MWLVHSALTQLLMPQDLAATPAPALVLSLMRQLLFRKVSCSLLLLLLLLLPLLLPLTKAVICCCYCRSMKTLFPLPVLLLLTMEAIVCCCAAVLSMLSVLPLKATYCC